MIKKIIGGAILAALSLATISSPALAGNTQGGAGTLVLNPGGARLADGSDGIVITLNGVEDGAAMTGVETDEGIPSNEATGSDNVYFAQTDQWCCSGVSPMLSIGGDLYGEAGPVNNTDGFSWTSIEILSSTGAKETIANGSAAAITSTETGNATASIRYTVFIEGATESDPDLTYTVTRDITYTYPNTYYDETWTFVIPAGNTAAVKFYLGGDVAPGGSDYGVGESATIDGLLHIREKNPLSGQYISYIELAANSKFDYYYVGSFDDVYDTMLTGANLPSTVDTSPGDDPESPGHDAGIDMQWNLGSTAGTFTRTMRTKIGFINDLALAETGVEASGIALAGLALAAVGAVVVVRRRARA